MNIAVVLFILFLLCSMVVFYLVIMNMEYNRHIEQSRKVNSFLSTSKRYKYSPGVDSFPTILLRKFGNI